MFSLSGSVLNFGTVVLIISSVSPSSLASKANLFKLLISFAEVTIAVFPLTLISPRTVFPIESIIPILLS